MGKDIKSSQLGYNYLLTLVKNVHAPINERTEAMWQLVNIADPDALEELIIIADQPATPDFKEAVIRAIGELTAKLKQQENPNDG